MDRFRPFVHFLQHASTGSGVSKPADGAFTRFPPPADLTGGPNKPGLVVVDRPT